SRKKPCPPRCGRNEGRSCGAGLHVKLSYIAHFRRCIGRKKLKNFGDFGARSRRLIVRSVAGSGSAHQGQETLPVKREIQKLLHGPSPKARQNMILAKRRAPVPSEN